MGKTGRRPVLGALILAGAMCLAATAARAQSVTVGTASGNAGQEVTFNVTLQTGGQTVAGAQNDITYVPAFGSVPSKLVCNSDPTQSCATNQECIDASGDPLDTCVKAPQCDVNTVIKKEATRFAYQPPGCAPGTDCTGVRAIVFSAINTRAIPDGAVLYTCKFDIAGGASGTSPLTNSNALLSTPAGGQIDATAVSGSVSTGGEVTPPPTAATSATPTHSTAPPTAATSATPTHTTAAAATATPTATKTPSRVPATSTPSGPSGGFEDEDGCQIGSRGTGHTASLLLLCAVGLLAMRRRRR